MINIVCFPHYTCGGLLCDILNEKFSPVGPRGSIDSIEHSFGKIGDANTVQSNFNPEVFYEKISNIPAGTWVGTHCHPHLLDTSKFNKIVSVTTETHRSKIYRWLRVYYHYFQVQKDWQGLDGIDKIDKDRETAKNYLIGFETVNKHNVINIEFAEIVEKSTEFKLLTDGLDIDRHIDRWQEINSFLYNTDLWNSIPVKRFYEAELEVKLSRDYRYQ